MNIKIIDEIKARLPLTGGTMTGPITFGTTDLTSPSDGALTFGGKHIVRSINGVSADAAGNVSDVSDLWTDAKGRIIRFTNGLQICYGTREVVTGGAYTFPAAFIYVHAVASVYNTESATYNIQINAETASYTVYVKKTVNGNTSVTYDKVVMSWIAIGAWK